MAEARPDAVADPDTIAMNAEWLPSGIDPPADTITFVHIRRSDHAKVPFLTREYLAATPQITLSGEAIDRSLTPVGYRQHFIFHSAFCCSTLLARALDIPGISMGLKEPEVLNDLAALARAQRSVPNRLDLITRLLGRPFGADEAVVIKPSNVANLLIENLMLASPDARAILLHAPLPHFLASLARRGLWGRNWARKLFALLSRETPLDFGYSDAELFEQTDLQIAALAWLLHQGQFAALLRRMPDRIRAIDSETLLADRLASLRNVSDFFGLRLSAERCEAIASGPAFAEHAKKVGLAYDPAARAADRASAQSANSDEIEMVCQWAEAVGRHVGVPLTLPKEYALSSL